VEIEENSKLIKTFPDLDWNELIEGEILKNIIYNLNWYKFLFLLWYNSVSRRTCSIDQTTPKQSF
jgi:hypothetical protein